jgi:phosphoribosylformimino-5-aminoimidazole carboxamide ribotide isomerase
VGSLAGPAVELAGLLAARHPEASVLIGGGVRDLEDLHRIAEVGCAGALVGRAVHSGRIGRAEIQAAAAL